MSFLIPQRNIFILQVRGRPTSTSPPAAATGVVLNTAANRSQPILEILPATSLRKGPRGQLDRRGPADRRRRRRLLKLAGAAPDGAGGRRRGGSGGSCRFRTDSLPATLRRSNGLLQQGRPFERCQSYIPLILHSLLALRTFHDNRDMRQRSNFPPVTTNTCSKRGRPAGSPAG